MFQHAAVVKTGSAVTVVDDTSQSTASLGALSPSHQPQRRDSNDTANVNKLNFRSLGVHGREEEISILNRCFDQLLTGALERHLVLISGTSGSGKSKLADTLKKPTKKCNGLFVRGKFDIGCRSEPYSGIASACEEICDAILELQMSNPVQAYMICNQIKKELNSELPLLIQMIPVLEKVFRVDATHNKKQEMTDEQLSIHEESSESTADESTSSDAAFSLVDSKSRFHFAFVRFMRLMSAEFDPLVVVIDDLQWADAPSLELLEVIVTDRGNPKLLIIGTYRSNEVDAMHIFNLSLQDLRVKSLENDFALSEIEVGNLRVQDVHTILQKLLRCDNNERTLGLANVCFDKTMGNAFFLVQFLSMLCDEHLLRFGVSGYSWQWDEEEIKARTRASDNVVDLLKAKMTNLPKDSIEILKLAAYLGTTFELDTLTTVWKNKTKEIVPEQGRYDENLITGLAELETEGLLLNISKVTRRYAWAHDKIQEAAMAMIPKSDQISLGHSIGEILVSEMDDAGTQESDSSSTIFVALNLVNPAAGNGSMHEDLGAEKRLTLARLNCIASRKAISISAFESASVYATYGIRYLPENAWLDHYDLTLKLYSLGAKANAFIGNVERMERYCKEVMSQEHKPIEDKFDVYNSWLDSIMNRCLHGEAIDLMLDILGKFKCRFPTGAVGIGFEMAINVMNIKVTLKSRDASTLSKMNDKTRTELMKLLDKLSSSMFMEGDDRMPLCVFRSLNWSMKYGYCDYSSVAFATTGMMLTGILDDIQGGAKYGDQALALLEKSKSSSSASRTLYIVNAFLYGWTKPLKDLLKPLLHAYDVGLQSGDTESAMWAIHNWLVNKYIMGVSLDLLLPDLIVYMKQMKDLKRFQALYIDKCTHQMYLNLMGQNNLDDPTRIIGDALTEEDIEYCKKGTAVHQAMLHLIHGFLLATYGRHVEHADLTLKLGPNYIIKSMVAVQSNPRDVLLKGVSCFAAARQTGKKKYAKVAHQMKAKMDKWFDMGNPNIKHYKSFLDAEALALANKGKNGKKRSSTQVVIQQYEVAISQATRGGYKHDAALACERLGEYQLSLVSSTTAAADEDRHQAQKRFAQASKYWRSWGAMGKVHDLEQKYANLVTPPKEVRIESTTTKKQNIPLRA
ncbi:hypothetical protein ACA910_014170 [Epithemia clementina (nom. ined.)]